jgi:hypothetical protein
MKKSHVKKNRALLLLSRHLRRKRQEDNKDEFQKQSDKLRRIAKRITHSPWIKIEI